MSFLPLLRNKYKKPAYDLYQRLVQQARSPWFYQELQIEDSVKGRFELIALHCFLVLHRLKEHKKLAQALFDAMFSDLDRSLREMGVGDLSVGKKIKSFAELFYGRIECYEKGLQELSYFEEILGLFFGEAATNPSQLRRLAEYAKAQETHLKTLKESNFLTLEGLFMEVCDAAA